MKQVWSKKWHAPRAWVAALGVSVGLMGLSGCEETGTTDPAAGDGSATPVASAASTPVTEVAPLSPASAASAPEPAASVASEPAAAEAPSAEAQAATQVVSGPVLAGCPMFPVNAVFNTRIDDLPAHGQSSQWVGAIGASVPFHPDWGTTEDAYADDYYGIPWNVLDGKASTTDWPLTSLWWPDESNCGLKQANGSIAVQQDCGAVADQARFPFPKSGWKIEGGYLATNEGDRHVLLVEAGVCRLWETGYAYPQANGQWEAGGAAMWNLASNAMRPDNWTSADAAGLPMLPLLLKVDEAASGEIKHALRVTFRNPLMADKVHVWPASHHAGNDGTGTIPFGALLRLKAGVTIPANWGTQAKAIAVAMQRYGLYVADNGSNLYVQGEPSVRWDPNLIAQLKTLKMSDFEFVDTSGITSRAGFDARSYAVPAR
ncbi:MAG: hypothetical protein RI907_1983 [Pseudomonadota bacterium]|jgi:hypothetical protein